MIDLGLLEETSITLSHSKPSKRDATLAMIGNYKAPRKVAEQAILNINSSITYYVEAMCLFIKDTDLTRNLMFRPFRINRLIGNGESMHDEPTKLLKLKVENGENKPISDFHGVYSEKYHNLQKVISECYDHYAYKYHLEETLKEDEESELTIYKISVSQSRLITKTSTHPNDIKKDEAEDKTEVEKVDEDSEDIFGD